MYGDNLHQFYTNISREWRKNIFNSLNEANIYQMPKSDEDVTINEQACKVDEHRYKNASIK